MSTTPRHVPAPVELPDGAVPVPAHLAGPVRDLLVTAAWDLAKTNGGTVHPDLRTLIEQLHRADRRRDQAAGQPGSDTGTPDGGTGRLEVSTTDAALAMGCSVEYVRRLARSGRVNARRAGQRTWLITIREEHADADRD
ncbi:hypothetical protein JNW88_18845 [Micromonospora sp. ATA32]|nr:hypothetical protein [Micromonospora sp. ATA32]